MLAALLTALLCVVPSEPTGTADDPNRPSWSSTSSLFSSSVSSARFAPTEGPGTAGLVTGVAAAVGGLVGGAAGLVYNSTTTEPYSIGPPVLGVLIGTSAGAVVGSLIGVVTTEENVSPVAVPAAALAAPIGAVVGMGASAYVLLPFFVSVTFDPGADPTMATPLIGIAVVVGATFAAIAAGSTVRALRAGPPRVVAAPLAPPPPPAPLLPVVDDPAEAPSADHAAGEDLPPPPPPVPSSPLLDEERADVAPVP